MKSSKLLAAMVALASLVLAGCADLMPRAMDKKGPEPVKVSFDGGKLLVDPPIILVFEEWKEATLEWQLPANAGVVFTNNGIVIEGEVVFPGESREEVKGRQVTNASSLQIDSRKKSNFKCEPAQEGLKFICKSKMLETGIFKYTLQFQSKDGARVLKVDPPIVILKRPPG